jgi:hypothetical protein
LESRQGEFVMRIVLIAAGALILAVVLGALWVDEGEVVTLTTLDADGTYTTQLWIVEVDGDLYVRSSSPNTGWLGRLRVHPDVELDRDDETLELRAVPSGLPEVRAAVNGAMAEKYGSTDGFYSRIYDRSESVPVRLEPRTGATAAREPPASGAALP